MDKTEVLAIKKLNPEPTIPEPLTIDDLTCLGVIPGEGRTIDVFYCPPKPGEVCEDRTQLQPIVRVTLTLPGSGPVEMCRLDGKDIEATCVAAIFNDAAKQAARITVALNIYRVDWQAELQEPIVQGASGEIN